MRIAAAQPRLTGTFLIERPRSTESLKRSDPPAPISLRGTACSMRKKARVTTKDGMPRNDTSDPIASPITAPVATPASVASVQCQS